MRVTDQILDCVVFLCAASRKQGGSGFVYGGTGFFVSRPSETFPDKMKYVYLITAKHNVERAKKYGDLYLRINRHGGTGVQHIGIRDEWLYHENEAVDVAVLPLAPSVEEFAYKNIPASMFATKAVIDEHEIGVGDTLVITGLFTEHYGTNRNVPIVRVGNIAAMPGEPLVDEAGLKYRAYLAEVRSIGGLSGSPVFGYLGPARPIRGGLELGLKLVLIGLIRGHWDYKLRDTVDFNEDELAQVNMGIAIVTPITDVLEIIDGEYLVKARRRCDREFVTTEASALNDKEIL